LLAAAQQTDHGKADKAKAMLPKTVAALKADKTKTLDLFNKAEAHSSTAGVCEVAAGAVSEFLSAKRVAACDLSGF
jgi:hypothetical protein